MNNLLQRLLSLFRRIKYLYLLKDNVMYARKLGTSVGDRCSILDNPRSVFGSEPWLIRIGNHVEITSGVKFVTHKGDLWCVREKYEDLRNMDYFAPIVVGNNVMIGMDSIILPGVHIGNNVIIGSHSLVTRNVPDNSVYGGAPAVFLSSIEEYCNKIKSLELFPTKEMNSEQKKIFLQKKHPEWFGEI